MSGECRPDLQEEVGVVTEAVGNALDDLDLVVDALYLKKEKKGSE